MTRERHLFFDRFENRVTITATLQARTGMRIGAGRDDGAVATDLPLLALPDGRKLVPGSSLKGVVRSAAERYLRSLARSEDEVVKWACDPLGPPPGEGNGAPTRCWPRGKPKDGEQQENVSDTTRAQQERDGIAQHVCRACETFGAQGLGSHVLFSDLVLEGATHQVRDGVGIHRDLGRAADGIKYDYEVVDPGAKLPLRIELHNAADWQVGLLLAVLDDLNDGSVRIGGMGSRGLGWLSLVDGPEVCRREMKHVLARQPGEIARGEALERYHQAFARLAEEA